LILYILHLLYILALTLFPSFYQALFRATGFKFSYTALIGLHLAPALVLPALFHWLFSSHMTYSSTLKMETSDSSQTLIPFYQNTQCYIPEDSNLNFNNIKLYMLTRCWKWPLVDALEHNFTSDLTHFFLE
jgi:hypothetical protein